MMAHGDILAWLTEHVHAKIIAKDNMYWRNRLSDIVWIESEDGKHIV
jgi:hypothetical protein